MIVADIILIIISIAALIFASITDIKTKEVPDWLSYALIASGLFIRLLHSIIFSEYLYILYGILGFASMFILGNILYHTKQWGGGDAKLIMGLGSTLATTPFYLTTSSIPFLAILVVFIMFSGAIYGLVWSLSLIFKNIKKFKQEFKNINKTITAKTLKILSLITTILLIVIIILLPRDYTFILIVLTVLTMLYPFLYLAIKSIENLYLYSYFTIDKLMEGDWIAEDIKRNNKILFHKKTSITKRDIKKLKELNIKKILIKDGIPFVPPFLMGTILALIIGNPLI